MNGIDYNISTLSAELSTITTWQAPSHSNNRPKLPRASFKNVQFIPGYKNTLFAKLKGDNDYLFIANVLKEKKFKGGKSQEDINIHKQYTLMTDFYIYKKNEQHKYVSEYVYMPEPELSNLQKNTASPKYNTPKLFKLRLSPMTSENVLLSPDGQKLLITNYDHKNNRNMVLYVYEKDSSDFWRNKYTDSINLKDSAIPFFVTKEGTHICVAADVDKSRSRLEFYSLNPLTCMLYHDIYFDHKIIKVFCNALWLVVVLNNNTLKIFANNKIDDFEDDKADTVPCNLDGYIMPIIDFTQNYNIMTVKTAENTIAEIFSINIEGIWNNISKQFINLIQDKEIDTEINDDTYQDSLNKISCIENSPDGMTVLTGYDDTVILLKNETEQESTDLIRTCFPALKAYQAIFSPDSNTLIINTSEDKKTLKMLQINSEDEWTETKTTVNSVTGEAVFSDDSRLFMTVTDDHTITLFAKDAQNKWQEKEAYNLLDLPYTSQIKAAIESVDFVHYDKRYILIGVIFKDHSFATVKILHEF